MRKKTSFEKQLVRLSLISSVPLLILLLWALFVADVSIWLIMLTALLGGVLVVYANHRIYQRLIYQFRSLSNLFDAMTHGDYSLRTRADDGLGELDELVSSINALARSMSRQRWESVESQLLLNTVIDHIDVAIVALSEQNQISFLNPAAKKLLLLERDNSSAELLKQLAFVQSFPSGHSQVVELSLGHQQGRFNVHVEEFRESGMQHKLLFITDVSVLLRSEERKAWQRLVRVISHEINNSLSPIASIGQTLKRMLKRPALDQENRQDLEDGLSIITQRAEGLRQFVDSYKQLARLPEPQKQVISFLDLMKKICLLFEKQQIVLESETDVQLFIDPVQFEQVLINIVKNAIEAMQQVKPDGVIIVKWQVRPPFFQLKIYDEGGGLSNPDNLFVPFYSTKKQGSGIGLVLCRQIIEAHNGSLSIENRPDSRGCCATLEIPLGLTAG